MSATDSDKHDLERGWRVLERLIEQGMGPEAEVSDEEVLRQMDAAGVPEGDVPSVEELLERTAAKAASRAVEARDVAAKSERWRGRGGASLASRGARTAQWVAAGAIAAALFAVLAWKREQVVAWWRGERIGPDHQLPPSPGPSPTREGPSPEELAQARKLRDDALAACDHGEWFDCAVGLDDAQKLDPAGEQEPRVQEARRRLGEAVLDGSAGKPGGKR